MLLRGVRLDTGVLATSLGISRATLFRHAGNREAILVDALWYLAELTLRRAEANADRTPDGARLRCLRVMEEFRRVVAGSPAISGLLADEPVLGVRLLTDPRGRLQPRLVDAYTALLSMSDPGEEPLTGSLLTADIGAGRYTYSSLIYYYQLDNLVPGAFRMMVNLLTPPG